MLFQTLEDAQQAAEEFGAYAVWKVRGNVLLPLLLVTSGRMNQASGSRFPRISGALSTMKDSHDSKHANIVCISAPFGVSGASPLMSTFNASRAGEFFALFPAALANQWPPSRGLFHALPKRSPRA